jgi:hypothetical protein
MSLAVQVLARTAVAWMTTSGAELAETPSSGASRWAGHQVTLGTRWIPFKGKVRTRMDSFVVAQGSWVDGRWVLVQEACAVRFSKVAGVRVHMDAKALPRSVFSFTPRAGESALDGRSRVAWDAEDIDEDGKPGMTVRVEARVCSGALHVTNDSRTRGTARFRGDAFGGFAQVHVRQKVIGAEGACLSMVADDTDEKVEGPFAYVPVPEGTRCRDLSIRDWPVDALSWE